MTKEPVCGMTIDPARAAARTEHAGKTYYFCSSHCQRTFQADPKKYAAATPRRRRSPQERDWPVRASRPGLFRSPLTHLK